MTRGFEKTQDYCGGWLCFYISLCFIGMVTALISDLAVGELGKLQPCGWEWGETSRMTVWWGVDSKGFGREGCNDGVITVSTSDQSKRY